MGRRCVGESFAAGGAPLEVQMNGKYLVRLEVDGRAQPRCISLRERKEAVLCQRQKPRRWEAVFWGGR